MAIERGKSASAKTRKQQPAGAIPSASEISALRSDKTKSSPRAQHAKPWTYTRRGYALAQGFRQLKSRKFASLTTLLVFGVTLALPALILFTANSLAAIGQQSVGEESVTAYLTLQTPDLAGAALANEIQTQAGVKQARYVSRDEALIPPPYRKPPLVSWPIALIGSMKWIRCNLICVGSNAYKRL